jgi:hypothetical protein
MYRVFQPFRLQPPIIAPVAWLVSATGRTVEANHRIRLTHSGRVSPTSIGLRLGLAGSPRRQAESSSSSYGLIVHLPMLSTSPRRDAVPVGYGTQARPRQGLPPCWFDTLTIARVPRLPPGAFIPTTRIARGAAHGLESRRMMTSAARMAKRSQHPSERRTGCPKRTSGDGAWAAPAPPTGRRAGSSPAARGGSAGRAPAARRA